MMNLRILAHRIKESREFPNFLTRVRLATCWIPSLLLLCAFWLDSTTYHWWALVTFVLIAATDQLDGFLARRWKQVSDFGKFWDPFADKALVLPLVATLCATGILASPWGWAFLAFNLVREAGVIILRLRAKKGSVPASLNGKIKMVLQTAGIILALMPMTAPWWPWAIWTPLAVSVWFSITSGIDYLKAK